MFHFIISALFCAAAILGFPRSSAAQSSPHVPGELLIASRAGVSDTDLENQYKALGGSKIRTIPQIKVHHIKVPDKALEAIESALRKNPKVEYVEKNLLGFAEIVPNDPGFSSQWHLQDIAAPAGWDLTVGSPAAVIAVIDSGVEASHPDLAPNLVTGYNFLNNSNNTNDTFGHGTAVAGVAAAVGNSGIGVSGVSWRNRIMPLVVVDSSGQATTSDVSNAIVYAADHGAKVINLSLAFISSSSTMQNAINYAWNKGLVIVAAAANYSTSTPYYPAALNNVLAVSATDPNGNFADFSNYGNWIDLAAPGVSVYTTMTGGSYGFGYGTSVASPIVAGVAALVFSLNPTLTSSQVVDYMVKNSDDLGTPGFDPYFGWGKVNVQRILQAVSRDSSLSIDIIAPADGSVIPPGAVDVQVNAQSSVGVSKVELYVDGVLQGSSSVAPYTILWNTGAGSGQRKLVTRVYDKAHNTADSPVETVTIASSDTTPPTVGLTSVAFDGKFLTVTVAASDQQSDVKKVELFIDNVLKATDTASPWIFKLNTRPWAPGSHTVQVKAYDAAGNVGVSAPATITK